MRRCGFGLNFDFTIPTFVRQFLLTYSQSQGTGKPGTYWNRNRKKGRGPWDRLVWYGFPKCPVGLARQAFDVLSASLSALMMYEGPTTQHNTSEQWHTNRPGQWEVPSIMCRYLSLCDVERTQQQPPRGRGQSPSDLRYAICRKVEGFTLYLPYLACDSAHPS